MPKSRLIKVLTRLLHLLPFIIVVIVGVPIIGMASTEISKMIGLSSVPVPVIGTGSMYPSLFWSTSEGGPEDENKKVIEEYRSTPHLYRRFDGITIAGQTLFRRSISYGDLIAFKNAKTVEILQAEDKDTTSGFIKRVIGVPGDTIELRDGFVYKNNSLLSEPYISTPRSSYGGSGLKDCEKITIPPSEYFVLGDNRKVSSDSRFELGLIGDKDIAFVLPYIKQQLYRSLWRDTAKDDELLGQPSLSSAEFVTLVNAARKTKGITQLTLKPALTKSTTLRGEKLLANEKTNFGLKQAVESAGYSNIVLGEFVSYGHFSAKELLENLLYNTATAKQIMSKDFSDIAVSAVNRAINGCPTQVIVGHLGGYIPASYDQATVDSWRSLRDNLRGIIPSWEKALDYQNINQTKLSTLLTLLHKRQLLAEEIVLTMEKNDWLTVSQEERIKADGADADVAETLAKELNQE